MKTRNLLSNKVIVICLKGKHIVCFLLLLSYPGYGQVFKNIGVTSGVNFTPLKWEYRYAGSHPIEKRKSKQQPIGFNIYLTADLLEKKHWGFHSSLGWILKKGMFTEDRSRDISIPYNLHYISWINSMNAKIRVGECLSLNLALGPRVEYLLTAWDAIPVYAPNDPYVLLLP